MCSRGGVLLLDGGDPLLAENLRQSDEGRPEPSMDERVFPVDQLEAKDVRRIIEHAERVKNLRALRVPPPTAANRFAGHCLGDAGDRSLAGSQDDSVLRHELHWVEGG